MLACGFFSNPEANDTASRQLMAQVVGASSIVTFVAFALSLAILVLWLVSTAINGGLARVVAKIEKMGRVPPGVEEKKGRSTAEEEKGLGDSKP